MRNKPDTQPGDLLEKPTLSVCMIVRDEEKTLGRCLKSVRAVADELIVVDTGSVDKAISVAQDFGAKLFHFEWCNDFSAAKNETLKHVTGDWILTMDADEELQSESIRHLQEHILRPEVLCYMVKCDNGPDVEPRFCWLDRLFRNHSKIHYQRPYHESIWDSVENVIASEPRWVKETAPDIVIRHYGYEPSKIPKKDKRGVEIMESYLKGNPDDDYLLGKLGIVYYNSGRYERAEKCLTKALEATPKWPHGNHTMGLILTHKNRMEAANEYYKKAVAGDPGFAEPYVYLATNYMKKGMIQEAILELRRALAINPELAFAQSQFAKAERILDESVAKLKSKPAHDPNAASDFNDLGFAFICKGMYEEAIKELKRAITLDPKLANAHLNLGMAYLKKGMLDDGLLSLESALDIDPDYGKAHLNLAVAYYQKGDYKKAIQHCDKAVQLGDSVHPQLLELLKPFRQNGE